MSGRFPDTATLGTGKPTIEFVAWLSSVAAEIGARIVADGFRRNAA